MSKRMHRCTPRGTCYFLVSHIWRLVGVGDFLEEATVVIVVFVYV